MTAMLSVARGKPTGYRLTFLNVDATLYETKGKPKGATLVDCKIVKSPTYVPTSWRT